LDGFEKEAFEFLNVVNTKTTKVGFGIRDNYVIGYFCPRADTDPESLKLNTPRQLV